jgi:Fe-S cluster biosynthesis and repair protein YggX
MADVTCARCGQTRAGAGRVLPGAIGDEIEQRVCAQCWTEWLAQQIRVINHYGLRPALREDREKLYDFTRDFLGLTAPEGDPIPPAS